MGFGVKQKRPNSVEEAVAATIELESYLSAPGRSAYRCVDSITRNFGRSLRIPDASMQTSVNFPRTRPLTCMEQSAFLFSINQESTEKRKAVKNIVKNIFHYALLMKQKNSGSICRFHGPKTTRP